MNEVEPQDPLKEPFIQQLKNLVLGLFLLVICLILLGNSEWEYFFTNFILSFFVSSITIPLLVKSNKPNLNYGQLLDRFMGFKKYEHRTGYSLLMGYLSNISTISLCYTVLGYTHFHLKLIPDWIWPFFSAPLVLFFLVLSSLSLIELLYHINLNVKLQDKKKLILIMAIGSAALLLQMLFLKVGVEAINQYKPNNITKNFEAKSINELGIIYYKKRNVMS